MYQIWTFSTRNDCCCIGSGHFQKGIAAALASGHFFCLFCLLVLLFCIFSPGFLVNNSFFCLFCLFCLFLRKFWGRFFLWCFCLFCLLVLLFCIVLHFFPIDYRFFCLFCIYCKSFRGRFFLTGTGGKGLEAGKLAVLSELDKIYECNAHELFWCATLHSALWVQCSCCIWECNAPTWFMSAMLMLCLGVQRSDLIYECNAHALFGVQRSDLTYECNAHVFSSGTQ